MCALPSRYYRKAKALIELHEFEDAKKLLDGALFVIPSDKAASLVAVHREAQRLKKEASDREKHMYKRMVGALDGSSADIKKMEEEEA